MADYKTRFIRPDVWMDTYHGFTAGASLKLDMLKMAAAHMKRDEHRIQLTKTFSLMSLDSAKWLIFKSTGGWSSNSMKSTSMRTTRATIAVRSRRCH